MVASPRRGIHWYHSQGAALSRPEHFEAAGHMDLGSTSVLEYQLTGDSQLEDWLRRRSLYNGLQVFVRLYPVGPQAAPAAVAERIKNLAVAYPYVTGWLPCNEPNLEGWASPAAIAAWTQLLWWNADYYRSQWGAQFRLYWPPLAQDCPPPMHHAAVWEVCRASIELYLDHGDGIAWHSYWPAGSPRLIEDEMPDWLRVRLPNVPTLLHECGRLPGEPADFAQIGAETLDHVRRSVSKAATAWLLGSRDPAFEGWAWVDEAGGLRQPVFDYRAFGGTL